MRDGKIVQVGTPKELVFSPADDYVSQFTGEVPRIRVLTAGQIAAPTRGDTAAMPAVPATQSVEDLLPVLANNPSGVLITADDGSLLGTVTPDSVVRHLSGIDDSDVTETSPASAT